jgi:uncharacterized protein (TIGR02118 family)
MIKVVVLLPRQEDMFFENFESHLRKIHLPLVAALPGLRRLVINRVLPGPDGSPGYDALMEEWFDDLATMATAFSSPAGQAVMADAPHFLDMRRIQFFVVSEGGIVAPRVTDLALPVADGGLHPSHNGSPSIKDLLDQYGSDKGRLFGGLYDALLQPIRHQIQCLLEIGIGTLMPHAPSSMVGEGSNRYQPGASLRAWRDFLPNAHIHGMDVAPDTQFADEHRITTHLGDSTDPEQAASVLVKLTNPPDIIIDDGLHTIGAQVWTLKNLLPALRAGGLYVVEDGTRLSVQDIIKAVQAIHPGCHTFQVGLVDSDTAAVVIRKPA